MSTTSLKTHIVSLVSGAIARPLKAARMALVAGCTVAGLGVLAAPLPASATDWSFLSNKNYISCLQLYAYGNFMMPANLTPAQQAAYHERGRHMCNRQFYGHD